MGRADHPPQPAQPASDFVTTNRRLRSLHSGLPVSKAKLIHYRALQRLSKFVLDRFTTFGDDLKKLPRYDGRTTRAEWAYTNLQDKARRVEIDGDSARASAIRGVLAEIDRHAAENLQSLTVTHAQAGPSSARQPQQAPATTVPTIDWRTAYRQCLDIRRYFEHVNQQDDAQQFLVAMRRMEDHVRRRFETHGGKREDLFRIGIGHLTRPEQMCRFLEDVARRTKPASGTKKPSGIHRTIQTLNENARKELSSLTRTYGSLEDLAARAGLTQQQAPATVSSTPTSATAQATVAPPLQPVDPVPVPGSVPVDTSLPPAGEAGQTQWVSATPSPVAAISSTPLRTAPWLEDHYAVERALIAGQLPPGFDASQLITEARACEQFGLATALAAGRLPMPDIEALIEEGEAADKGGSHALSIHYLRTLKKDIQNALHAAYPERVGREWLDRVRQLLLRHEALAAAIASPPLSPFASRRPESGTVEIPSIADLYSEPGGSE